jgi:hypothetical protein
MVQHTGGNDLRSTVNRRVASWLVINLELRNCLTGTALVVMQPVYSDRWDSDLSQRRKSYRCDPDMHWEARNEDAPAFGNPRS